MGKQDEVQLNKYAELKEKLVIDEYKLEIADRDNPALVEEVGVEYAYAVSDRDLAKQQLDELDAKIDKELREAAAKDGEKITDKQVEAYKKLDPRLIKANRHYLDLKLGASLWSVLKDSVDARTKSIAGLIELYKHNYYSHMEKKGPEDVFRTVRADQVKQELATRRRVKV